jgi:hypothetical protein
MLATPGPSLQNGHLAPSPTLAHLNALEQTLPGERQSLEAL